MPSTAGARQRVAIVGAGISGLTAAYRLKQAGMEPTVFEASDYVGGRIKSFQKSDFLVDIGAFIYLGSYLESVDLIKELGLEPELGKFDAYGAMPREGKLKYLDLNKPIRTILGTDYLSAGSKLKSLKLFRLLYKHWDNLNYQDATGIAEIDNDTVASYCRRELNEEIYHYLASVVVRGPWLTNPETTSIGQLLWTLKNFFKPYFYGLDGGMDALPRALAQRLNVKLEHGVLNVTDHGDYTEVVYKTPEGSENVERFDRCVITTTTDRALAIFPQMDAVQKAFYQSTEYISSVNTHLCLSERPQNPATYIMVSPKENPDLCGVIVDHLKADKRAPAHKGQMTVFCRTEWCESNLEASDERVIDQVLGFLKPYYGDLQSTLEDCAIGRWPLVVPKMPQGRFKQIVEYQRSIDPRARVQFAGDLEPIGGVNAALVSGQKAARRILAAA
jgi:protoporphyrinogen oxidase